MDVIYKKVADLIEYKNNPRKNDAAVDACAKSIKTFGFRVPVVIDRNNVIVAGHTRIKAARKLGIDMVPCIAADNLTDEQARAFRLADNKTQELSSWDFTALFEELDMIPAEYDVSDFGFELNDDDSGDVGEQDFQDGREIDVAEFSDEKFNCTCPSCGFRFND